MGGKLQWTNLKNFPWLIFFVAIVIWLALAGANYYYQSQGGYTGTGILFPISVIYPNQFLWSGFVFAFLFLIVGIFAFQYSEKLNVYLLFLIAIVLVILGNLSQGNFDIAFLQPFYLKGRQYYTDALNITDGQIWLRDFAKNLEQFQMHTKTHPPFVTLLHYWILNISNIETLAIVFFAIGSLSFPLFYKILVYLGFEETRRKWTLLLLAVIPSVNIYLLVSIDALVLTSTLIFLLGFARIFHQHKIDSVSFLLISSGLILTNLLTFSGLFLFAFLGCISFYFVIKGKWNFVWLSLMTAAVFVLTFSIIYATTGYDQLDTFLLASESENPDGFRLFHQPFIYLMTRLEDIGEIFLFLSFGFLAIFFSKKSGTEVFDNRNINILFFSAISAISAMLLTGAYGTGETARACLFLVPYFLILLKNIGSEQFKIMFYLCLFQTFGMQMIGNFYW
ncbi:hypothetical protein [Epilithonimonas arachidiradicis]|uniref:Glycosyltransferase RgtA/B/C/D-like domain-containing protein n=1 Tax=Epilithonimonas arachidiradicis TaxID=1617282 RepID=A0A420DEA6_9FLAO|nr:hypothetical protein [Epilithonimonas arachidiradicis]RKE90113.1 hypothetical protein BXY58_0701 [Epilithonimonas arachidiradicis]GGG47844.1 hypothetical protein GCM10007332_06690 [Epilithonimonas arachidiradicis]